MMPLAAYATRVGRIPMQETVGSVVPNSQRVVVGRLRRGADRLGAIQVEHKVDLGPRTSQRVEELQQSIRTIRTGVIVVGAVGAIVLAAALLYYASRPSSGRR